VNAASTTAAVGCDEKRSAATLGDRLALGLVCLASAASAIVVYVLFLDDSRNLWTVIEHDRSFHYLAGLRMGLDIRNLDVVQLVSDFLSLRTWPPLHAVLVALVTAVGGPHYQIAVLPSLTAWCGTAILALLIVRRITPAGGNLGGIAAALFVLASPGFRVMAADIMLESLGAFLTLLVVYFYIVDRQSGVRPGKPFVIALSCLFFEKYNYWLVAVIALTLTEISCLGVSGLRDIVRSVLGLPWREWLARQRRQPLTYVAVALGAFALATHMLGGMQANVLGVPIRFGRSSQNLWQIAFIAVVIRAAACWSAEGRLLWRRLPEGVRRLCLWHGAPIVVWFLLPKRLG
jgi:hypothetical protein